MDQEQMNLIRMIVVTALAAHNRVTETLLSPDEGDVVYATINGDEFALTIEPI
jgi:hypothetical protein